MGFEMTGGDGQVRLSGALTIYEAAELKRALLTVTGNVNLDLSAVTELDGAGFQVLVAFSKELADAGCRLTVEEASDPVRAVFSALGADCYWAPLRRDAP